METNRYLTDFYNNYDEDSRLTVKHGSVEFLTTMHYIGKYIKPGDRVLEIGAGTGRYSHALARQSHTVDAVELIEHNIEVFRRNTLPGENITVVQGNALDLSAFQDNTYDITLLLGPLYHLYSREDKQQALREAIRVTGREASFSQPMLSPTAVSLTRASTAAISMWPNILKWGCSTPGHLPPVRNRRIYLSLCGKRISTI